MAVLITFRPEDGKWLVWCTTCFWEEVVSNENAAASKRENHKCRA